MFDIFDRESSLDEISKAVNVNLGFLVFIGT